MIKSLALILILFFTAPAAALQNGDATQMDSVNMFSDVQDGKDGSKVIDLTFYYYSKAVGGNLYFETGYVNCECDLYIEKDHVTRSSKSGQLSSSDQHFFIDIHRWDAEKYKGKRGFVKCKIGTGGTPIEVKSSVSFR